MSGNQLNRLILLIVLMLICAGVWKYRLDRQEADRIAFVRFSQTGENRSGTADSSDGSGAVHANGLSRGIAVSNWPSVASAGSVLGNPNAPVRIVEFADFLCGYCRKNASAVKSLLRAHPAEVAVVYRNYPIFGEESYPAAVAAQCAARQGRFAEAHEALYGETLPESGWEDALVLAAGIPDTAAFHGCVEHQETRVQVDADRLAGAESGVRGTPAFVVNGHLHPGAKTLEQLEALLQDALGHPR